MKILGSTLSIENKKKEKIRKSQDTTQAFQDLCRQDLVLTHGASVSVCAHTPTYSVMKGARLG